MNKKLSVILRDLLWTAIFVFLAIASCELVFNFMNGKNDILISTICMLSVILVACFTHGYVYAFVASALITILSLLLFTYMQTDLVLFTTALPFLLMLSIVAFTTSTMKQFMSDKEKIHSESEKEKMRGNLLRAISHDIRTPLTSILGASSAILENGEQLGDEEKYDLVKSINDEATWLVQMVENLLTVTRISGEIGELKTTSEIAEEIVSSAVSKFRSRFSTPTVSIEIPDELLIVPMDSILIEQVLRNLMENVVKHSGGATKIMVRLKKDGDFAVFEVEDNGVGIPNEKLKSGIFSGMLSQSDKNQGDSSRNMGIGLSVCNSIVKAHKGEMFAENTKNGAMFYFKLPIDKNMEEEYNG